MDDDFYFGMSVSLVSLSREDFCISSLVFFSRYVVGFHGVML